MLKIYLKQYFYLKNFINLKFYFKYNFKRLLSTYSYYKLLAVFPMLYNTSLSLSYTQWFVPLKSLHWPPTPPLVTTSLFSISVSLLKEYF